MAKRKHEVDNVVRSHTKIELMVAAPVACTTEQLVAKGILTAGADSLDDILQCAYERARTGDRSVDYNIVE